MKNGKIDRYLFDGGYAQASVASATTDNFAFYYYNQDHLGNIREVVDASGNILQVTNYYPFGTPYFDSSSTKNADMQPYKYNGKELDRMHGLDAYDYGARQYDPILARWDRIDPLCEKYYNISPYAYCANNPVKYIDPDGRKIRICQKDRNQVLGYINKLAQGTFAVDKSGYLFLSKPSDSKGFSRTYTESLVRAINNKEKTIMVFVDNYYLDKDDNKQDISLKGEGTTKEFFNGNISVVISGKTYNGLVDKDGNSISDKPEFILAHEIAGHAEPRLNDNGKGDVVNAVEIENAIRRETNEKERKEEPEHVQ
jgi:RHS repeat-associated protein